MLRDLLSNRFFLGSFFVVFVLCLVGLHFWSQQAHRELRESEEETRRFILQLEKERAASAVRQAEQPESVGEEQTDFLLVPYDTVTDTKGNANTPIEAVPELSDDTFLAIEKGMADSTEPVELSGESENVANATEIEQIVQFINTRFATASELYYERLEIRKRRRRVHLPNGISYYTWPPGDKERLEEIQIEVYNALLPIGDLVPGAVEVELHQHSSGEYGCHKYFFPHIFEEALGEVPEGYYQFDAALDPFIKPPVGQR